MHHVTARATQTSTDRAGARPASAFVVSSLTATMMRSEGSRASAHANVGYVVGGLAREVNYGGAIAAAATPRLTFTGELIGRAGDRVVSIPLPQIELPRFTFGANPKSGAPGEGDKGSGSEASMRRDSRSGHVG